MRLKPTLIVTLEIVLAILIVNDFILHSIGYPFWTVFEWIWEQGQLYYDLFWSIYWGIGLILIFSIIFLEIKGRNAPHIRRD